MPDLAIGGGQRVVLEYLRHADRHRFDARVAFISSSGALHEQFEATGTEPILLDYVRGHGLRNSIRLARCIRREGVDLLHVHGGVTQRYGQSAALLTGTPVVAHLHSTWISDGVSPRQLRSWTADRGLTWIEHRTISHYIACTAAVRDVYQPHVRAPITVIDNGVSVSPENPHTGELRAGLRASLGLASDAQIILSVGVLEPRKRIDTLVAMMDRLTRDHPNAVLVVAGEGPERDRLEAQIADADLGSRVQLLGSRHDVDVLLAAADIFAFASAREGLPLAVLEAMAARTPVVTSRLPALEGLVEDGIEAVLVDIGDADGFAAAVGKLLDGEDAAVAMAGAGQRMIFKRFDAADMARSFEAVYRQVLDPPEASRVGGEREKAEHSVR